MIGHPKIGLDTPQKDIEVDALVILCQSIPSHVGTLFPTENRFLEAILKFQVVRMKLLHCQFEKTFFWRYYCKKEVSVTVYINVMSYLLVCWVYCEPPTPSLPIHLQLPLRLKLDPDPRVKTWYKLPYYMMGGINMKSGGQV